MKVICKTRPRYVAGYSLGTDLSNLLLFVVPNIPQLHWFVPVAHVSKQIKGPQPTATTPESSWAIEQSIGRVLIDIQWQTTRTKQAKQQLRTKSELDTIVTWPAGPIKRPSVKCGRHARPLSDDTTRTHHLRFIIVFGQTCLGNERRPIPNTTSGPLLPSAPFAADKRQ